MCGRLALTLEGSAICKACGYTDTAGNTRSLVWQANQAGDGRGYIPLYNVAPNDIVACIVSGHHFNSPDKHVLYPMIWGVIPRWHEGDHRSYGIHTHNARLEGIENSKLYSVPLSRGQRCVILCEGYYDWQSTRQARKNESQPYFVYAKQEEGVKIEDRGTWKKEGVKLLKLAGIFDSWMSRESKKIFSCTMITKSASAMLSWLHHRVPVVLETDEEVDNWLDYRNVPLKNAIANCHSQPTIDTLGWHPVDKAVNDRKFQSDTCYQPIELKRTKGLAAASKLMAAWLKTGSMTTAKKRKLDSDPNAAKSDSE